MGIKDFFSKKRENQENDYSIFNCEFGETNSIDTQVFISSVKKYSDYIRQDGKKVDIVVAKMMEDLYGKHDLGTSYVQQLPTPEQCDNVVFEIPSNMNKQQLETLIQIMTDYYEKAKNVDQKSKYMYLGYIDEYSRGEQQTDRNVLEFINENILPTLQQENVELKTRRDRSTQTTQNQTQVEQAEQEWKNSLRVNQDYELLKRKQRISNAEIHQKSDFYYNKDGKSCIDYDGINVRNGDILKIRQLEKVGKDENGTYLYSGYIQSVFDKDKYESLGDETPLGIPVCFATDMRVEDIVHKQDIQEVYSLLTMLSAEDNFRNNNGILNYIGKLDKYNRIFPDINETSKAIQDSVASLKQKFYLEKQERDRQEQQNH